MAKIKVDRARIEKKIKVAKGTIKAARNIAEKVLKEAKKDYMEAFEAHPITRELSAGIHSENSSGTLGGYGNLRTFMGFSSNPIPTLRELLKNAFSIKKEMKARSKDGIRTFVFSYPDRAYLESKNQLNLEFESGRNWVLAIERGISGFSNYMYKKFRTGRSGKGLQTDSTISRRVSSFKTMPYRTVFEEAFRKRIKKFK